MTLPVILSEYLVYVLLSIPGIVLLRRQVPAAAYIAASLIGAWLIGLFIKDFFYLPRPFPLLRLDGSFPSNHTAASFAVATAMVVRFGPRWLPLYLLAALVGVGRVLTHVHYPLDIWGGAAFGTAVALLLTYINFEKLVGKPHSKD